MKIILKLRYISFNSDFSFKLSLDIALIIALFISLSGILNGLTTSFETLIFTTTGGESVYFIGYEKGKTLEKSEIPKDIVENLDRSLITYLTPILAKSIFFENINHEFYYLNITEMLLKKSSFKVESGNIPTQKNEILVGKGLKETLNIGINFPIQIMIQIDNKTVNKTIVGTFEDFSPWNFGLIEQISSISNETTYYSGFEFQIKNKLVFDVFKSNTDKFVSEHSDGLKIYYNNLKKSTILIESLYQQIYSLFIFISTFIFMLLAIKIIHSSWILFLKLKNNLIITKMIGMSSLTIQLDFLGVLLIIGNLGLLFGIIIGLILPQALSLVINMVSNDFNANFTPNTIDVILSVFLTNFIFILSSFWIKKLNSLNHKSLQSENS